MISDDRLHRTRFCKKGGGLTKTFLIKRGIGAKGGALTISYFEGGVGLAKKKGVTFLRGGSYPGAQYVLLDLILEHPHALFENHT